VQRSMNADGKQSITIDVNTRQIQSDLHKGRDKMGGFFKKTFLPTMKKLVKADLSYDEVKKLVEDARVEMDPVKREAMYMQIQEIAKDDVHWIDLYYSPYINVTRSNIENFTQNPLGRFFLEDTVKN